MKNFLKTTRVTVAGVVLAAFTLLLLDLGGVFHAALGWLPKLEFWPAVMAMNVGIVVLWLVLTVLFGRIYCSTFCPLGVLQDGVYELKSAGSKKKRFSLGYRKAHNVLRYLILGAFIVAVAFGWGATAYLVEPYSIFGRAVTSTFGKSLPIGLISVVTLALIAVLVLRSGRGVWCNVVCPVGSVLSIFSRKSIFRPVIDTDKCVGCGLCARGCRAGCIDAKNHTVDMSRCVVCFDCIDNCREGAISFKSPMVHPSPSAGAGRRAFINASALALGSAVTAKAAGGLREGLAVLEDKVVPERKVPVVPPGAESLQSFDNHCIGCQLCVSACPSGVLRPSSDPQRLMQPEMNFDKGFCRPECTVCSDVCPAGAIRKVTREQKSAISIGHAVYVPMNCVVITDGVSCGNCARHCPAGAISMVEQKEDEALGFDSSLKIPAVNAERCIGCGRCEYVCPSRPLSAIYVEGNRVHRNI